jgi:hypothetical protein
MSTLCLSRFIVKAFLFVLLIQQAALRGVVVGLAEIEYACKDVHFPFCDTAKPVNERVDDLISRLTLQEKFLQLSDNAASIPRLGIPHYEWWQEALHGVAQSPGVTFDGPIKRATSFPQTILTAASFNDTLFHQIAQVRISIFRGQAVLNSYGARLLRRTRAAKSADGQDARYVLKRL